MKIIKYEKKSNNNYKVYLDNGNNIILNEDVILNNNLLYKKEMDENLLEKLTNEEVDANIYSKCIKYIGYRLRSTNEMYNYLKKLTDNTNLIESTISKLKKNKLLDDEIFTKAFIKDKVNFTSSGPYKIMEELKIVHNIDNSIIERYIKEIDNDILESKIDKYINKQIKSNKNKPLLRNKIYIHLINSGYSNDLVVKLLNKYF